MAVSNKNAAARQGLVRTSGVNPQLAQSLAVGQHFRFIDSLPTISNQFADGVAVIDLPVGLYTYRAFCLSVGSTVGIGGPETISESGGYRINWANINKYVEAIDVEIDGKVQISYTIDELMDMNECMRWNVKDGFMWMCFGSPGFFNDYPLAEDAYLLGTGDIRSLRLLVKLKAAWAATMSLRLVCEYAPIKRPVGYIVTMRTQRYVIPATGETTISDIPHGVDLSAIWVRGMNNKRINGFSLKVDDQLMFDCLGSSYAALAQLWGKDHAQLAAGNLFIDFWREGNPNKSLASLTADAQVRRNADIRLTLDMGEAGAEIKVITLHSGLYQLQK